MILIYVLVAFTRLTFAAVNSPDNVTLVTADHKSLELPSGPSGYTLPKGEFDLGIRFSAKTGRFHFSVNTASPIGLQQVWALT